MVTKRHKKIIILATYVGEIMLKSGAEIYRVEDTITRICKACKITYVETFVMPTGIFVSIDDGSEENDIFTYVKRVKGAGIDLAKISELNQFSREFATTDLSIEDGWEWVKKIAGKKEFSLPIKTLGAALVTAGFCGLFHGTWFDMACAAIIGPMAFLLSELLGKLNTNFFVKDFLCCGISTFLALICVAIGIGTDSAAIAIGVIMLFVPGVAITNGLRDLIASDMVSGIARITEAFCIAAGLAVGAGAALQIWVALGGTIV